jgi:hypothetical protein
VYGVPGNLMLSLAAPLQTADAVSFSDTCGLVASNGHLRLLRLNGVEIASSEYRGATPLLGANPDAARAIAWLPNTQRVLWWNGKSFQTIPVAGLEKGDVATWITLADAVTAKAFFSHADGSVSLVTVALPDGNVRSVDYVADARGTAFQAGKYTIWAGKDGLELETQSGLRNTLPFSGSTFIAEQMSSQWIHLYVPADGSHWALHVGSSEPKLSRLPAVPRA